MKLRVKRREPIKSSLISGTNQITVLVPHKIYFRNKVLFLNKPKMNTSKEIKRKNMLRRAASALMAGPAPPKMTKYWPDSAPPADRNDSSDYDANHSSNDADDDSPKPVSPPEQPKRKRFRMERCDGLAPRKQLSRCLQQKNPNPYDLVPETPPVSPKKPKRANRKQIQTIPSRREQIERFEQAKELEEIREKFERVEVNENEQQLKRRPHAQPLRRSKRLQELERTEKRRSKRLDKTWKDLI